MAAPIKLNLTNAANVAITCTRGDTFLVESLRFWTDEAKTVPLDITGYEFAMQVKNSLDEIVIDFTMASGFVITAPNILEIIKPAADMLVEASPEGEPYVYDLEMTDGSGIVTTIMKGTVTVLQDITNA